MRERWWPMARSLRLFYGQACVIVLLDNPVSLAVGCQFRCQLRPPAWPLTSGHPRWVRYRPPATHIAIGAGYRSLSESHFAAMRPSCGAGLSPLQNGLLDSCLRPCGFRPMSNSAITGGVVVSAILLSLIAIFGPAIRYWFRSASEKMWAQRLDEPPS